MIDLSLAKVAHFSDDPETWPPKLRLRGFTYETLDNDGYVPGVYDQLASAYRHAGSLEAARTVSIAKQKRRRREPNTVGYGYRTWLAGLWLLGLLTVGSVVFGAAYPGSVVGDGRVGGAG